MSLLHIVASHRLAVLELATVTNSKETAGHAVTVAYSPDVAFLPKTDQHQGKTI